MEIGKIPQDILNKCVFNMISNKREEVLLEPSIGEDCSAVELKDDEIFVISTDPITGADKDMGYLAVYINTNDIASSGAEPVGVMVTILLPPNSKEEQLYNIMEQIDKACSELNIQIMGGHTEVTDAVVKPILSVTAIGKVKKDNLISTSGAKAGQDVIITKWAGLEGTSIIVKDNYEKLSQQFSNELLQEAISLDKHLSVLKESIIAKDYEVTSMHDVTEGGVLGAIWEVASCSNMGIEVDLDKIPIRNETIDICNYYNIDPYKLISSGCMVMTTYKGNELVKELKRNNIEAAVIGKITEEKNKIINVKGNKVDVVEPDTDELYKI